MLRKSLARKISCALAMGTLLNGVPVFAAEPTFELDMITVTATRTEQTIADTPANVEIITAEEIEKGQYRNVGEALEHKTGLNIISHGYPGGASAVLINGSEKVLVLVDGRRVNLPQGVGHGGATVDLTNLISMDNIERIEVVKGGASAIYGSDAVGGVINIITKKGQEPRTTLKTGGGNFGRENYALITEGKDDKLSWYITAQKDRSGDIKTGKGARLSDTGYSGESYTLRLDRELNDKAGLSFAYENLRNEKELRGGTWSNNDQHNWDLSYRITNSANTDNSFKIYQNSSDRYGSDYEGPYTNDATINGFNYQLNSRLDAKHLLTVGYEYRQDKLDSSIYGDRSNINQGLFAQDQWQFNDQLKLNAGLRYDKNHTYGNELTPHVALNYKKNDRTNYFASWGRVFRAPGFDDLYWPHQEFNAWYDDEGNLIAPPAVFDGNPDLKPETGWSAEVGVNYHFDDSMQGKFSLFRRELHDAIDWDYTISPDGTWYWKPENVDEEKASGVEVQLTKQLSPKWRTYVGYTYMKIEKNYAGSGFVRDPNAPTDTWNVGIGYNSGNLQADIRGMAVSGRTSSNFAEKSYWVWDANVQFPVAKGYEAFLTIRNIFDKDYEEVATYPCAGRSFMLGVKRTF